ncbi:uncharacterized protein LOC113350958 [Papaver somniferum]|uniref:uncharacterized protein LOC113350958 n=1 Tax=Papaver somniferum TaxID=3469 RepID=UPI000E6FC3F5|nr:uncharacterized protein LOC113350958 [Papaver somniferum]
MLLNLVSNANPQFAVSEFIDKETKTWNVELVNAYFTQQNASNIFNIRIPLSGCDRIIWPHTKNGLFTIKSAYKNISGQNIHMNNSQSSNPVYKSLWRLPILPKVHLFVWKCHENILPAKTVLARFSNGHDTSYNIFKSGTSESPEHIILHCDFSKSVWALTPYADVIEQDSTSNINLQEWVTKWLTHDALKKNAGVVFSVAWSIWKDRCSNTFRGKNLNHHSTARISLKLVNDTELYLNGFDTHALVRTEFTVDKTIDHVTCSFPFNCHIIFSDAAYDKDNNLSGIGLVLTDLAGSFLGCKLKDGNVRNAEEAESMALFEAVKWAKAKGLDKVCFVSDAKIVIEYFNSSNNQLNWYNKTVIDDCKTIIPCLV